MDFDYADRRTQARKGTAAANHVNKHGLARFKPPPIACCARCQWAANACASEDRLLEQRQEQKQTIQQVPLAVLVLGPRLAVTLQQPARRKAERVEGFNARIRM
jgi:hypothetical protein